MIGIVITIWNRRRWHDASPSSEMLGRHRANYNMQDTVLAQLLYHLNVAHNLRCLHATLVRCRSTISRYWACVEPTNCALESISPIVMLSASDPLLQPSHHRLCLAIGTRRWLKKGSTFINLSFVYILYITPFRPRSGPFNCPSELSRAHTL